MKDKTAGGANTGADFEKKLIELTAIVEKLESDISLEEGMKLFETGLDLTEECISDLNATRDGIAALKGRLDLILDRTIVGGGDE